VLVGFWVQSKIHLGRQHCLLRSIYTCISAINFGLCVINYNMNVLNISVLLAWDYMSRVRDGTLNLCACYDRNVYAFYNHSKLSGYGYVWINMVKVFIWCMSPCWFTNLRCLYYIGVLVCKCPNGLWLPCGIDLLLPIYRFKLGAISGTGRAASWGKFGFEQIQVTHLLCIYIFLFCGFILQIQVVFIFPVARHEQVEIDKLTDKCIFVQIHLVHITARRYGMTML